MMATRIERIEIGAFGCLSDVVLTPASGVNLLEAPNEAGKSTLAAFIKFVLYGFSSTRSQSIAENEKKLYMPWNGTRASGSLVVVCPSGSFRVERTYDLPSKEHVEIVNLQTRKPVFQSLVPGEVLFGAPEELFVKSAYFRQLFQSKNGDDALAEQVQNILFSADERISAEKAQKRLREAKAELRKGGMSDELLAECDGHADTEDQEILAARKAFAEAEAKYKKEIQEEADKVRAAGGLYILGTERHESRRIDNQLRGRAGRQGDPGETRFFLSLEDDIMRLFGSERVMGMMEKLGVDEDTPIDAKMLSNAIENAQKQVESRNFQTRKNVLQYDDVMNTQREVIYKQRRQVLDGEDLQQSIQSMLRSTIENAIRGHMGEQKHMTAEEFREATALFHTMFLLPDELRLTDEELQGYTADGLVDLVMEKAQAVYQRKEQEFTPPLMRELERVIMLRVVDEYWMDHIDAMDNLRRGIGLRGYGNVKPIDAYKKEGFDMFEAMISGIRSEVVRRIYTVRVRKEERVERKSVTKNAVANAGGDASVRKQPVKKVKKPGRNDPCPCGKLRPNGLPMKYKDCCGKNQ